jgi:hypothetical protein
MKSAKDLLFELKKQPVRNCLQRIELSTKTCHWREIADSLQSVFVVKYVLICSEFYN